MKKILLLIVLPFASIAQDKKLRLDLDSYTTVPVTGEYFMQVGATVGLKKQISTNWDVVVGVGLDLNYEEDMIEPFLFIPASLKFTYAGSKKRVSPLFSFKAGYLFDFEQDPFYDYSAFAEPRAGVQIRFGPKVKLRTGLGYNVLLFKEYDYWMHNSSTNGSNQISHAVSVFLGCSF